eukprot:4420807-Amphidinium_carterae.1
MAAPSQEMAPHQSCATSDPHPSSTENGSKRYSKVFVKCLGSGLVLGTLPNQPALFNDPSA